MKPEDFAKNYNWRITDLNKYEKIHYFGDIQVSDIELQFHDKKGCFTPLKQYFDINPMNDKHLYVFTGNLLNRGIENYEVLNFFLSIYEKENVTIIEGISL